MYDYVALTDNWGNLEYRPKANSSEFYQFLLYGNMKKRAMHINVLECLPSLDLISLKSKSFQIDVLPKKMPITPLKDEENTPEDGLVQNVNTRFKYHKLESQQSLTDIAKIFDVSLRDIIRLNNIDIFDPPAPGTVIKVQELATDG